MAWRKGLVRSLVFTVAAVLVAAGLAYQHWTDPAIVRQKVIATLQEHLPGADVSLDSAQLKLLGGISFHELRLSGRNDATHTDFIYVPSGTICYDKEQLRKGRIAISRIYWQKPILRLFRTAQGHWNLAHILAPPTPDVPIPTIVLQHATVFVEDRQSCPDTAPIEIRDVDLVLLNDPHQPPSLSVLTFKGKGVADLVGTMHVDGSMDRRTYELNAALDLPRFAVDGALIERLSHLCPEAATHARQLTGVGSVQAQLHYHPDAEQPWQHDLFCHLRHGRLSHARLPFDLENLDADLHCVDGQLTLENLTAQAGPTQLRLVGRAMALHLNTDILDGRLEAKHVRVTKALFQALPWPAVQEIEQDYAPQGLFGLTMDFSRRKGQWREHCTIELEEITGVCARFPYPLHHVTGTLDQDIDPARGVDRLKVDLVGFSGAQPIFVQGKVEGKKPAAVDLQIHAKNIPLDDKLRAALPPQFQDLVRSFHPRGFADIQASVCRSQGTSHFANQYVCQFHDASVVYDSFPYPLENVRGTLTIQPEHWEYDNFRGSHQGGEFQSRGRSVRMAEGEGARIEITGHNVALDGELKAALKRPTVEGAWDKLVARGRMDFEAGVFLRPGRAEPEIDVLVKPDGCTLKPQFFPYVLTELRGTVHYRQHMVELQNLTARHVSPGNAVTLLSLKKGQVSFADDGGVAVQLSNLQGNIIPDTEFIAALPPALGRACQSLHLQEPVSLGTDLTILVAADQRTPPQIRWDGGVRMQHASLVAGVPLEQVDGQIWCHGEHRGGVVGDVEGNLDVREATVFNQTLRDIHGKILVSAKEPDYLVLQNLLAQLHGGAISGAVRVDVGPNLRYEADLTALGMQLEQISRANHLSPGVQQSGLLNAHLHLVGQGSGLSGLKGAGSIDVPSGKMYNLPLLLDLLKFLSLHPPDRTMFEEAHLRFLVEGQRVEINRIDLLGAAFSLGGRGTVNLEGQAYNMELYAVWGRIVQLSPAPIRELWPKLSQTLLKIKMTGKLGEPPHFERDLVPPLTEPLERMLERLTRKPSS